MNEKLILTIDFGTQSVRVGLFNKKGEIIDLVKKPYEPAYFSKKQGYAEQDPDYYYKKLCEASQEIIKKNSQRIPDILGINMSFFRDSVVPLDKDNKPLRPVILWLDQRRAKGLKKLPFLSRAIFSLIGMGPTVDLNLKRSMSRWIQEEEPEIWEKTDKFMMISTYITFLLTGEYADSPCSQAGHLPIDFKKGKWYKNADKHLKGQIFNVPNKKLCRLVPVGNVIGTITEKASRETGLPVGLKMFSGGSDKSAETLGLGVISDDMASISYGTACTVEVPIKKYKSAEPFLPSYPAIIPGYYNLDVQVYRGYWMLNWFVKEFGGNGAELENKIQSTLLLEDLNKKMLEIEPGCNGLVLQPYWGPGLRRPLAKGAIVGFSDCHTSVHMYRAIIEGIAYCLREGLELFEKRRLHHKVKSLRISGGGSRSPAICQITADVFGLKVAKVQTEECSSLGAAIAGFLAAGEFKNVEEAVKSMVQKTEEFEPNMVNHERYDYLFKHVYMKMYPKLKNIYKKAR